MDYLTNVSLNVLPSPPDIRDIQYNQKKIELKRATDLREWDSPIEDQGGVGSCVAHAITSAYEITVRKLYPSAYVNLSRLFVYYNSRILDNTITADVGTYIRDGLKACARYGICSEYVWPYVEYKFGAQPSPECYVDAAIRTVTLYESLYTLRDLLEVLNDGMPIVIGMDIYNDFYKLTADYSIMKSPVDNELSVGKHAVVLVGYNLDSQLFLFKNSFGSSWGINGYAWMPFEYLRTQVFEKWRFDISSQHVVADITSIETPISVDSNQTT